MIASIDILKLDHACFLLIYLFHFWQHRHLLPKGLKVMLSAIKVRETPQVPWVQTQLIWWRSLFLDKWGIEKILVMDYVCPGYHKRDFSIYTINKTGMKYVNFSLFLVVFLYCSTTSFYSIYFLYRYSSSSSPSPLSSFSFSSSSSSSSSCFFT